MSEEERPSKGQGKAVKSRQTVGAAMTKQKVENMCSAGRRKNREEKKRTSLTQ